MNSLKDVRVPGVLWVALLILAGGLIHGNGEWIQANLGLPPIVLDILLGMIFAYAKKVAPGTGDLDAAIDAAEAAVIKRQAPPAQPGMRSSHAEAAVVEPVSIPARPNRWVTWLAG